MAADYKKKVMESTWISSFEGSSPIPYLVEHGIKEESYFKILCSFLKVDLKEKPKSEEEYWSFFYKTFIKGALFPKGSISTSTSPWYFNQKNGKIVVHMPFRIALLDQRVILGSDEQVTFASVQIGVKLSKLSSICRGKVSASALNKEFKKEVIAKTDRTKITGTAPIGNGQAIVKPVLLNYGLVKFMPAANASIVADKFKINKDFQKLLSQAIAANSGDKDE